MIATTKLGALIPRAQIEMIKSPNLLGPLTAITNPIDTPIIVAKNMATQASKSVAGKASLIASKTGLSVMNDLPRSGARKPSALKGTRLSM